MNEQWLLSQQVFYPRFCINYSACCDKAQGNQMSRFTSTLRYIIEPSCEWFWSELSLLSGQFNSQSLHIIFQCAIAVLPVADIETCKYSMVFRRTRSLSSLLSPSVREGKSRRMEKGQVSPLPPLSLTHNISDKLVWDTNMWQSNQSFCPSATTGMNTQNKSATINITQVLVKYCVSQTHN